MRSRRIFIGSRSTASSRAIKSIRRLQPWKTRPSCNKWNGKCPALENNLITYRTKQMPLPIDYHNHPQAHSVKPYTPELLQPWAESARKRGLKQVAFTDHDRYHHGVDFDEIDKLRAANPDLKFLAGIELDNDPQTGKAGRAWVEKNWNRLDFVLGSAHYLPPDPVMFDKTDRVDEFATSDIPAECAKYIAE